MNDAAFHPGEKIIQRRVGAEQKMANIGEKVIRSFMPEQHRQFFESLTTLFIGAEDGHGHLWAGALFGQSGFIQSPSATCLTVQSNLDKQHPLANSLCVGADIGLLGLEFETRRRNRLNATIDASSEAMLRLLVKQSFGNCPKYIQRRQRTAGQFDNAALALQSFSVFENTALDLISRSDSFYIASKYSAEKHLRNNGVDVSHRGGMPGFIVVESDRSIIFPDYSGNQFFNTIGNLQLDPSAGLLFIDYEHGHQLMLSGSAEVVWADDEVLPFDKVDRMLRFTLQRGVILKNSVPWRWQLQDYSSHSEFYKK